MIYAVFATIVFAVALVCGGLLMVGMFNANQTVQVGTSIQETDYERIQYCKNQGFDGYDKEKQLCFWHGVITDDDGMDELTKFYGNELESNPEKEMLAKLACNEKGYSWIDFKCWKQSSIEDDNCRGLLGESVELQLWINVEDSDDVVCFGNPYLEELLKQKEEIFDKI